jgi:hypothetical protein
VQNVGNVRLEFPIRKGDIQLSFKINSPKELAALELNKELPPCNQGITITKEDLNCDAFQPSLVDEFLHLCETF